MGLATTSPSTSLDKSKIKILLLEGIHQSAVESFRADGYSDIEYHPKSLPEPDLIAAAAGAYFIGIRSATKLTARVIESAPHLTGIGCFCIGTNQVDLDAAQDRGIPVFNAPFSNTRSVAELVLAEIIMLMRGIPQRNAAAHRGGWIKTAAGSREVRGKTLGIVGYGHIGTQIGVLAEAVGMRVLFYDIESKLALGNARSVPTLDALLEAADVVTLHVPETPQTTGHDRRGAVCADEAGRAADQRVARDGGGYRRAGGGARGRDTWRARRSTFFRRSRKAPATSSCRRCAGLENVILTPHIGGSTEEAQQNIGIEVAEKLIRYSNTGTTLTAVNFPEVSLPEHPGKHRLLHIHRNQPGVLSAINAIFSDERINMVGQYLQTNARIGYVVIDIEIGEPEQSLEIKRRLDKVAGTMRTRILY